MLRRDTPAVGRVRDETEADLASIRAHGRPGYELRSAYNSRVQFIYCIADTPGKHLLLMEGSPSQVVQYITGYAEGLRSHAVGPPDVDIKYADAPRLNDQFVRLRKEDRGADILIEHDADGDAYTRSLKEGDYWLHKGMDAKFKAEFIVTRVDNKGVWGIPNPNYKGEQ